MKALRLLVARITGLFGVQRRAAELDVEVRAHLDLLAEEYRLQGMPPDAALLAARRDFGSVAWTAERYRAQGGLPFFETLVQDLRYAARMWRHAPGFGAVVVVVLALGIGVNSAMFTLVNALLFRPLPGRDGSLVGVYSHDPTTPNSYRIFSYPNYADVRDHNDVFDGLLAYSMSRVGQPVGDIMQRTSIEVVSANFFSTLGVNLAAGRGFTPDEDAPGANRPVAIANYASWQKTGLDPAFIGSTIRLNSTDFTIVGVAPKGFTGTTALIVPNLWLPIGVFDSIVTDPLKNNGRSLSDRSNAALMVAGYLKQGVSIAQANARLASLSEGMDRAYPGENKNQVLTVNPLSRINVSYTPSSDAGAELGSGFLLMPLSGAVLLIACLNIANMLLARGTARKKEIAIRLALGGGRFRIVRQLLTESLMLALAGAAAGLMVGWAVMQWLIASIAPAIPLHFDARPDGHVILAAAIFAGVSTLVFGLAPALKITRPDLVDDLKDLGGSHRPSRRFGTREWLVVCQIAISLTLMTAGGLFARAALQANAADPGYRYDHLLLASIDPTLAHYDDAQGRARLTAALERLRRLPGVAAVGPNSQVPFGNEHQDCMVARPEQRSEFAREATYTIVTADYFKAVGLPILHGRDFSAAEESATSRAPFAIIDEPLARQLFPNEDPLGQQVLIPVRLARKTAEPENDPMTIVGIVPGIRDALTDPDLSPPPLRVVLERLRWRDAPARAHDRAWND